ncbi:MAG: DUF1365 domain-containing protein [Gallionella sp.]
MNAPRIYLGQVMHQRFSPRAHGFSYAHYFLRCSVDELAALRVPFFSLERFNLFSFYRRDYGARDGSDLAAWARALLLENGITAADGAIYLHTLPRVLGYVFNPISFWFCHDQAGEVRAIVCEVNNTFGERHIYLLAHPDQSPILENQTLHCQKIFHVSPFMATEGNYRFTFKWQEYAVFCINHYAPDDTLLLATALSGKPQAYSSRALIKLFFRHLWLTLAVMLRIHWQAFALWRKGIKFFTKPAPPIQEISK